MSKRITPAEFIWSAVDTVVLDMDGTLLDLNFDDHVWNRLLPERYAALHGIRSERAHEEIREKLATMHGTIEWYRFQHWENLTGVDLMAVEKDLAHMIQPRPGAREFLDFLASQPLRVILATNADRCSLHHKLEVSGIDEAIETIVSSHDYGVAKEQPEFWESLISALDFDVQRALFIDDNHAVLAAARDFGIAYTFGIQLPNTRGETISSSEFYCLESFEELTGRGAPAASRDARL